MINTYYIKHRDTLCAIMEYDDEKDLYSMNIVDLNLFHGYAPKVFLVDALVRKWIEKRLTPPYQKGYAEKMEKLGLDINDPDHRIKLFFLTRACVCDDLCWLAYSEDEPFENSPLYEAGYR